MKVRVAPGAREEHGYYADDNGRFEYTITLTVKETLKGGLKGIVDDLEVMQCLGANRRYEDWAKTQTQLLCLLGPTPKAGERRGWQIVPTGSDGLPAFSANFTLLENEKQLLARARVTPTRPQRWNRHTHCRYPTPCLVAAAARTGTR